MLNDFILFLPTKTFNNQNILEEYKKINKKKKNEFVAHAILRALTQSCTNTYTHSGRHTQRQYLTIGEKFCHQYLFI